MKTHNQTIKCDVVSCAHNSEDARCDLGSIKVSASTACQCDEVRRSDDSKCASFENKGI